MSYQKVRNIAIEIMMEILLWCGMASALAMIVFSVYEIFRGFR